MKFLALFFLTLALFFLTKPIQAIDATNFKLIQNKTQITGNYSLRLYCTVYITTEKKWLGYDNKLTSNENEARKFVPSEFHEMVGWTINNYGYDNCQIKPERMPDNWKQVLIDKSIDRFPSIWYLDTTLNKEWRWIAEGYIETREPIRTHVPSTPILRPSFMPVFSGGGGC